VLDYLKDEDPEAQKLLFTGLDTAGKTSIILALQREWSKIAILSPTRGAQRRMFGFLGKTVSEWDLGGQISYRINYLKNPSKYFDNTEIAIYVIDVQNKTRIPESISYLKDVIEQFDKLEIHPPIFIFLHKYDPALVRTAANEMKTLIVDLKSKIKKAANYDNFYFYQTSIYDFAGLIKAMSEILLTLYPKSELIEKTILEFANKVKCEGVYLIDNNSLLIGSYSQNDVVRNTLNASMPYLLTLNDSFQNTEAIGEEIEDQMVVKRYNKYFIFKQIPLKTGSPPYYLLVLKGDPEFENDDVESFSHLLREILYN
jgi:GTPase SAR1 family protein